MNSGLTEHTRLEEDCFEKSSEFSPPERKRLRLDENNSNSNLNSILNSASKNNVKRLCSRDNSLVEPELMEDLGVGMLEEGSSSSEDISKLESHGHTSSPNISDNRRKFCDKANRLENQKNSFRNSSLETANIDRLYQDEMDGDDPAAVVGNESGYSSRVEIDHFGDMKENLYKDNVNLSDKSIVDSFYLYRRKRKPSVIGEDEFNKLSDEMILMILKWLPKKFLVRCMLVCKRWCQIARDEALWSRLDLNNKVLTEGTLGHILPRGVQILRLAQAEIADPIFYDCSEVFSDYYVSKLQYLDLSMAVISPKGLASILGKCKYLKKLSLEKCVVNKACCKAIGHNTNLEVLNLTMCNGMDVECTRNLMKLKSLSAVNLGWCSLDTESMAVLCKTLPPSVIRLNIAGCRKSVTDDNIKDLVKSCPDFVELDLSDCTMLTINTVHSLLTLSKLEHLSLSRCYSIPPSSYLRLAYMPCLLFLDVFGLMSEQILKTLQANCGETEINKFLYSSVARPTVGFRRTSIWGLRVRD